MVETLLISEAFEIELGDGLRIQGNVQLLDDGLAKPVLIASHGFQGFKEWGFWPRVTSEISLRGYYTVSFDFSRVYAGKSGADEKLLAAVSTISAELADLGIVLAELVSGRLPHARQADLNRIALWGHSRAGISNLVFASEHPEIRAVTVWNGGASPQLPEGEKTDWSARQLAVFEDLANNEDRFDIRSVLAELAVPVLFVQGGDDSDRLLSAFRTNRTIAPHQSFVQIQGADHTFGVSHPLNGTTPYLEEAFEATAAFLSNSY